MAENSKIEWTDATWNPTTGCTKVSQGCKNCYAERIFARPYPGRKFTDVRIHPDRLNQPLSWRKPRRIFVNSMSDLFHEEVPFEFIDQVFAVMALASQHTFQILTKRPERMRDYMLNASRELRVWNAADRIACDLNLSEQHPSADYLLAGPCGSTWPLPNVWLGVSVENQETADERIPLLLQTPAAVRFLSCEPLLGPIDLAGSYVDTFRERCREVIRDRTPTPRWIDWVIAGGESGPRARPAHPDWFRSLRDQCAAGAGDVPFFFKQWGEWGPLEHSAAADDAGWQGRGDWMILDAGGGLDIPDHRWPDEEAGEVAVVRVGKKRAGRMLDGRTWEEYPQ